MSLLTAQGLHVRVNGNRLLKDVSCRLERGRLTGLIGPNGAGKTTLLRALLRLQALEQGRILWRDEDITARRPHEMSDSFAYLPQGQTVHWPLTVEALVALGRRPSVTPFSRLGATDCSVIDRALDQTGLESMRDRAITTLSGGERARALLARVLASEAEVVLADEPVAALDPYHQLSILEILKDWSRQGQAVLIVVHDLSLARLFCDDVIVLNQGEVSASGSCAEVLTSPNLESVYGVEFHLTDAGAVVPLSRLSRES